MANVKHQPQRASVRLTVLDRLTVQERYASALRLGQDRTPARCG